MSDAAAPIADDTPLAPADTLHGQLQRGRGAGFLRALQENPTTVHALLYHCIIHDPRWDQQVEDRAEYYAQLVTVTHMDLAPLEQYLRTLQDERNDSDAWLAIGALGSLARLGNATALTILRHYIAYGTQWESALLKLVELADPAATAGLADSFYARFATGEQMNKFDAHALLDRHLYPLMQSWSLTHPGMERLYAEAETMWTTIWAAYPQRRSWPAVNYEARPVSELLAAIDSSNRRQIEKMLFARLHQADIAQYVAAFSSEHHLVWWVAFQCLVALEAAAPFYDMLLHKLLAYLGSGNSRALRGLQLTYAGRILQQLPPEMTLPLARRWFAAPEWHLRSVGEDILEAQATLEDIPQVRAGLIAALATATRHNSDSYRICAVLDILARFPDLGLLPEVEAAFVQAGYSFARRRAARTMRVNAPAAFATTYAYECLWDCEEETRWIGCESVPLAAPGARDRLHAMTADPSENDLVKAAIAQRLAVIGEEE